MSELSGELGNELGKRSRGGVIGLVLGGLMGALALPGCANHVAVPAEIATCPCASGAFCCPSGVCAPDTTGCDAATAALSNSVEGEWQGYFENFTLSKDDSLTVSIVVADDGTMSGHVTIGQATPPAPPTDPSAPWPPDLTLTFGDVPSLPQYVPGFAYQAQHVRWEAQRLRFEIEQFEPWQRSCQLQTSYPTSSGTYNCVPGSGGGAISGSGSDEQCLAEDDRGNVVAQVPCFPFLLLCRGVGSGPCQCDAGGCTVNPGPVYTFDVALRDGLGDGSSSLTGGNVRLNQTNH